MPARTGLQVAERLYYDQQEVTEFTAEVTAIREVARIDGKQVWQIALDRTAFYPTSGGQPFDTGSLIATARSGAELVVPISDVQEDETGEVWHTTGKPLQEGTPVFGRVDAARRRDHMQQHSGQHLLSALLYRDLEVQTVSFHLGAQHSTIDLATGSLSDEVLRSVEQAANDFTREALPVSVRYVSRSEAEAMLADGLLRKLPPRTGTIRLVEIPAIDCNACGGTHVANTAAVGPLLLRGTERVKEGLRLFFVCGDRALNAARADFLQVTSLAHSLSTGTDKVAESILRLQAESRATAKERTLLLRSLAKAEAIALAASDPGSMSQVTQVLDTQQPGRDAAFARMFASSLVTDTCALSALIAVPEGERCSVVLSAKQETADCGTLLRALLTEFGGQGGGSRELAQGNLPAAHLQAFLARAACSLPVE